MNIVEKGSKKGDICCILHPKNTVHIPQKNRFIVAKKLNFDQICSKKVYVPAQRI